MSHCGKVTIRTRLYWVGLNIEKKSSWQNPDLVQGSNLTVARSPLATENNDRQLKTNSKVTRLATDLKKNKIKINN